MKKKSNFKSGDEMRSSEGYKTKQREQIEDMMRRIDSAHITVDGLTVMLAQSGVSVGRTTVYRHLERMADAGRVRKYTAPAGESVCYQYVADGDRCAEHFHLKCEGCGRLIHMECTHMDELGQHIQAAHGFVLDRLKTVLYGVCEACAKK